MMGSPLTQPRDGRRNVRRGTAVRPVGSPADRVMRLGSIYCVCILLAGLGTTRTVIGQDCNVNGINDTIDILIGISQDCNATGIPDECEAGLPRALVRLTAPATYASDDRRQSVVAHDLDGDGDLDLITASTNADQISVLLNDGQGRFTVVINLDVGLQPTAVTAADLDGDGDLDLIAANWVSNDVTVLLNDGQARFTFGGRFPVGSGPRSLAAADLDADGYVDLVVANAVSQDVAILINLGNGAFAPAQFIRLGSTARAVVIADLDNNATPDLVVAHGSQVSGRVTVLSNDGRARFVTRANHRVSVSAPTSVAVADLDGNGLADLLITDDVTDNLVILFNEGNWGFSEPHLFAVGGGPQSVTTFDVDADGDLDLAVANGGSSDVTLLINEGGRQFRFQGDFSVGLRALSVTTGDLNGDGADDLAVGTSEISGVLGGVKVLLNASIFLGGEPDCNENAIPDSCEPDCDGNGVPDTCDIAQGTLADYNGNDIPDLCESSDVDGDGDVDLADFFVLQACFRGPGTTPIFAPCSFFDIDNDNDIDLADMLHFQAAFTGSQ